MDRDESYWAIVHGSDGEVHDWQRMPPGVYTWAFLDFADKYREHLWVQLAVDFVEAGVEGEDEIREHVERCGIRLRRSDDGRRFTLTIDREPRDVLEGVEGSGNPIVQYTGELVPASHPQVATLW